MQNTSKRAGFLEHDGGSVAVIFGVAVLPLTLIIGMAVDYGRAYTVKTHIQAAADAAALGAASVEGDVSDPIAAMRTKIKRYEMAQKIFQSNVATLKGGATITPQVKQTAESITVTAMASVPPTFTSPISSSYEVSADSSAMFGSGKAKTYPLCMVALNGQSPDTFKAWGTAQLVAPECAVHSASMNMSGMVTGGTANATAAQFCSAGGHSGSGFSPAVEDNCKSSADPYENKYTLAALKAQGVNLAAGCNEMSTPRLRSGTTTFNAGGGVYVFCAGIRVQAGATAVFKPGTYVFYNYVGFGSGSVIQASEGVTFVLADTAWMGGVKEAVLDVQGGANLNLKAPTSGPLAGVAIMQPSVMGYTGGTTPAATHTVIGGGVVNVEGIVYMPQSKLRVTGNGTINDTSKYFSVVADFIELEGNGVLNIIAGADVTVTGMPEMASTGDGKGVKPAQLLQ